MFSINLRSLSIKQLFLVLFLFSTVLSAQNNVSDDIKQDNSIEKGKWNFNLVPYLVFPSMDGTIYIANQSVDLDINSNDIFSNLDFGIMFYGEASNDKWVIVLDVSYMDLSQEGRVPLTKQKAIVGTDQFVGTVSGRYRITDWLDTGLGLRFNSVGADIEIEAGEGLVPFPEKNISDTKNWADPVIIGRAMKRFNDKWLLGLYADFGGFGIGSDFTWHINPFAAYKFNKWFELGAGYRWLSSDYETGNNQDYFRYDVITSGPDIKLSFHF